MKLLVVLLALVLLVWLVRGRSRRRSDTLRSGSAAASKPGPAPQAEAMLACAHCGVHLPASLALQAQGHAYCSAAHRDAGPQAR